MNRRATPRLRAKAQALAKPGSGSAARVQRSGARQRAFTLRELLGLMVGLALLALAVWAWRARSLDLPKRQVCQQNVRRLLAGFAEYAQVREHLPWAARLGQPHSNDWIYWQPERWLDQSSLAGFVPGWGSGLLRCPADREFAHRQYPYSYTMNAHLEKLHPARLRNRRQLILLFEEQFPNDGACAAGEAADRLARRHGGRSCAGFIDGHVELVSPSGGTRPDRVRPSLAW
jgi:prepilin-type processing-associated H-X9-DG protein